MKHAIRPVGFRRIVEIRPDPDSRIGYPSIPSNSITNTYLPFRFCYQHFVSYLIKLWWLWWWRYTDIQDRRTVRQTERQSLVPHRGANDFDISVNAFIDELFFERNKRILHHFRLTLCIHVPLYNKVYVTGRQVEAGREASKHIHLATHTRTHSHYTFCYHKPRAKYINGHHTVCTHM